MSAYAVRVLLLIGMVVFTIGLAIEVRNWQTGRRIISRKQQVIRLSVGLLVIVLFGLLFAGGFLTRGVDPITYMLYWMGCFVLACLIVVLMLLDLREVGNRYREQHREMLRKIAEEAKRK